MYTNPMDCISLLITALVYRRHCLLKPRSALFFVHIPKTGGTAFTIWLEQQHQQGNCLNIRTSHTHYIDSAMAVRMGYRPLVIIREPTERFLSSFYYWKYGSADIKSWQRNHDWKKAEHIPNAETFIQILKDPTHTQHQKLRTAITQQDNYTYRHHFLPQSAWLNTANKNILIACYHPSQLAQSLQATVAQPESQCLIDQYHAIEHAPQKSEKLSATAQQWLKKAYAEDYALWTQYCHPPPQKHASHH